MLDVRMIREQTEIVREGLRAYHFRGGTRAIRRHWEETLARSSPEIQRVDPGKYAPRHGNRGSAACE